jgi:hypothetical protein
MSKNPGNTVPAWSTGWLALEWILLYGGVPLLAFFNLVPVHKFLLFLAPVLYTLLCYWTCPRSALKPRPPFSWTWPVLRFVVSLGCLSAFVRLFHLEKWFYLPSHCPGLWVLIMLLYPLVSALPQEFAYRVFYFWRYAPLFPRPLAMIGSNALAFSMLHLMYDNWIAVVFSLIGGLYFAYTYSQSGRLIYPWIEHTLYGQAIFTLGLGYYFVEPLR